MSTDVEVGRDNYQIGESDLTTVVVRAMSNEDKYPINGKGLPTNKDETPIGVKSAQYTGLGMV